MAGFVKHYGDRRDNNRIAVLRQFFYDKIAELTIMPLEKIPTDAVHMGLNFCLLIEEFVSGPADMIEEYKKVFVDGDNL